MNRSWVRFPQAAQIRPPGSGWAFLCARVVLRCCLWPHGCSGRRVACLDGPGRCVCRWAAARPRDRHTRACGSEWSISRPALALPPPTGTAARPRVWRLARAPGPSGALHTCGAWCADVWLCASARCPARPRSPSGAAAGPSGALHTCGAWCADVWLCASPRSPARPRCRPRAPQPGPPVPSTPLGRVVLMRIHIIAELPQFRMQFPRDSFKS